MSVEAWGAVAVFIGLLAEMIRRIWRRNDERQEQREAAANAERKSVDAAWRDGDTGRLLDHYATGDKPSDGNPRK
jgi:hypothetical protein